MKIKYLSIAFVFLLVGITEVSAQYYSFSQLIKKADAAYEQTHFLEAIKYYQDAMELSKNPDPEILFRLGDAAFQNQSLGLSETTLQRYLDTDEPALAHEAIFRMGRIAQLKGDYAAAVRHYDLYLSEFSEVNAQYTKDIDFLRNSADWALNAEIKTEIDTVMRLGDDINTPASDNAPFWHNDNLYYSSLNYQIEGDDYNRYKSHILKESEVLNIPGVKENQLVSNPHFTQDGSTVYFSICDYVQVYSIDCKIYRAAVLDDGSIGSVVMLPEHINKEGFTTSHPTLKEDGTQTVLFFSSNRFGGKGGSDIWEVAVNGDSYGEPANVFAVNTARDEWTPFYHNSTGNLYFSSNGRQGYGGQDIYRLSEGATEPENMGSKLNSSYNDVHYFLTENGAKGFFSSNRPGSLYPENSYETCCYDIYASKSKDCEIDLKTLAYDAETREPLNGVTVKIYDNTTNEILYNQLASTNETKVKMPCDGDWKLLATREDYEDLELDLSDLGGVHGAENLVTKELLLKKDYSEIELTLKVFEEVAMKPIDGADVYLTEVGTNEVISKLANPDNSFVFPIKSNTDYILEINKEGFKEKTITFNSGIGQIELSKEAILEYLDVVQKSIVSLENAIPVTLYFDNDSPDPRTTNTFSSKTYTETFDSYYSQKDKFKVKYLNLFGNASDKVVANDEVENLFQSHIKQGFERYDAFKRQLLIVLQAGQDINIYLKGYASPIAQNDYNAALGKRRVDSIRKEFDSWNNGVLLPYIQSGQLKVTERSFGETTSPEGISDDPGAPSKSIYSPQASLERRVEIEEINFNEQ